MCEFSTAIYSDASSRVHPTNELAYGNQNVEISGLYSSNQHSQRECPVIEPPQGVHITKAQDRPFTQVLSFKSIDADEASQHLNTTSLMK